VYGRARIAGRRRIGHCVWRNRLTGVLRRDRGGWQQNWSHPPRRVRARKGFG
jgi:hypothetical protein